MPRLLRKQFLTKIPLQIVLLLPLLGLTVLAVALVGFLSFSNGQQAVNDVAYILRSEINAHIEGHVHTFLHMPKQINKANAEAFSRGALDVSDQAALERYFWEQIQLFDSVTSINFGNTVGGLANAGREGADGSLYVISTDGFASGPFNKYATDSHGQRAQLLETVPDFDARERSWYRNAVEKDTEIWSDVYVLFTGQDMSLSLSRPVYDAQQQLLGVTAVNLFLSHLSDFLAGLNIGLTGQSFIMERSGLLIAASTGEKPFNVADAVSAPLRIKASESTVSLTQSAAEALAGQFGDFRDIHTNQQFEFQLAGQRQLGQVIPFHDSGGLDWLIVTVIPETDFMAQINANNRITIFLMVITLLIIVGLSTLITRKIISPISQLNLAAGGLAKGNWEQTIQHHSRIGEINALSQSFNHMAGQLQQMVGKLTHEIAERKQTEEALIESETKFRTLVSNIPGVIFRSNMDSHWTMLFISDFIEEITGYPAHDFINNRVRTYISVIHPDDQGMVVRIIRENVALRKPYIVRYRVLNNKGNIRWVRENGQGVFDDTGQFQHLDGVIMDITERKQAEEALRRREEEFRALVENAPDIVIRFDRDLRNIYVNPALEKEMGIPREQFIGKTHREMGWSPENAKAWAAVLEDVFDTAQEKTHYFEYKTPQGWKYYHSRNVPEFAPDGSVETVLAITRDITAIKEMEAALYQERIKTYNMHQRALPDELPDPPGLNLAASYRPAADLQGDYYNVIHRQDQLLIYLVDIEEDRDNGVMQSLCVRKTIEDYLQAHGGDAPVSPGLLLRYLADRYHQDTQVETISLCIFIAVFDLDPAAGHPKSLHYASTGFCTPPLIIKKSSDANELLLENLYLSMDAGTELPEHSLDITPGSTFLFSTDGLFNQGPNTGSYEMRLRELLSKQAHLPPELVSQAVETEFAAFNSDHPLHNDIAFIILQVPKQEQCISFKVESDFKRIEDAKEKVSSLLKKELGLEPNLLHFHELLVNAMEHGNKRDGGKAVSIEFTVTDQYYKAIITDQGEGFNWRDKINREIDLESESERGRGIIMTRMMTDYLGYNERGNRVTMINLLK